MAGFLKGVGAYLGGTAFGKLFPHPKSPKPIAIGFPKQLTCGAKPTWAQAHALCRAWTGLGGGFGQALSEERCWIDAIERIETTFE